MKKKIKPYISIVIPVYNEADNLRLLLRRLNKTLRSLKKPYEIIFTNDGSSDNSMRILENIYQKQPSIIRVIDFKGNFGQHMAVMAGFELTKGEIIITLDADLQNPPEEILRLVAEMEKGYDLVSGYRIERQDNWFRRNVSKLINHVRDKITKIRMRDQGCMLRAYSRNIIDLMIATKSTSVFIPALAYSYAINPTEIPVEHEARFAGRSKYRLFDLLRLNFDLMTSYSLVPLQVFSLLGFCIAILSLLFVFYLLLRRLFLGPEVEGVFTLFAILFFIAGILLMGLGITGEYIGRIYQEVSRRPRFAIKKILGDDR